MLIALTDNGLLYLFSSLKLTLAGQISPKRSLRVYTSRFMTLLADTMGLND